MRQMVGSGVLALVLALIGCGKGGTPQEVKVDGSSTVAPMSMVAAELFMAQKPDIHVTVGISGTGGGFKKFLDPDPQLRTDINNASRPIGAREIETAQQNGVKFIELPMALDGIALVINKQNTFCDHLTTAELKRIWEPGSKINNWQDVRTGFPNLTLKLYGPGTDSGTFDYFTEVINGKEKSCRPDYNASAYPNVMVQGVTGDAGGLAFFGFSYYEANADKLKLLAIDNGDGKPVQPSIERIRAGAYHPLARPLFLYVNESSLQREPVASFVSYYLSDARKIVSHPKVGYVPLNDELYAAVRQRLERRMTGSAHAGHPPASRPADLGQRYFH